MNEESYILSVHYNRQGPANPQYSLYLDLPVNFSFELLSRKFERANLRGIDDHKFFHAICFKI